MKKTLNRKILKRTFWSLTAFSLSAPTTLLAHTGDMFRDEIGKVEQLFTGGYMRLGLLGVCGITAITGAIQQSMWMFASELLAGVFAFFMKDWILGTFTCLITG